MSAAALIRELTAAGIHLQARGARLHVEAPAGAVTADLRQRITESKAELVELVTLRATRSAMLELAERLGLDPAIVHCIPTGDLALWAMVPTDALRPYQLALGDTTTRQAGKVPLDDTAAIYCAGCGPVYVHPDIAAVLPVVDGWLRALGCPWCAIRKAGGYVPRPRVACASCGSYDPGTINPAAGVGDCATGHGTRHPMQRHGCDNHHPGIER